ncbi:methylenetetrahydrofolate reductase [Afifella sp. IM 167]|uniref:methylenetetrahydrofolate reductase n=1 Tax=Afifella sp. IM 167 TaxID=2033586 RepID=UPI001CCB135E|nr:methylenetetrahydrofolate reductase [Afifella sp. IM 167]MBZ8131669.1 methylenetetrahydrofolate reductase [NAD(P)H] [Afifella sp. IM 167]
MSSSEKQTGPELSFEFFPPKNDEQNEAFREAATRLAAFSPDFVSVTYGAGGSSKERSFAAIRLLVSELGLRAAAHLTCVSASCADVDAAIDTFARSGVTHFVALRGDPPEGPGTPYVAHPEGYADTADLIRGLKRISPFEISVSAYPERHPESPDWETELAILRRKREAGATRAITQFFYDNEDFERYRDRVRAAGIDIAVVPGLLPVHRFASVEKFAGRCGARIPESLRPLASLSGEAHFDAAVELCARQMEDLARRGVPGFHVYTLNQHKLVSAVLRAAGFNGDRRGSRNADRQAA